MMKGISLAMRAKGAKKSSVLYAFAKACLYLRRHDARPVRQQRVLEREVGL
jgi:hypothetical protein